MATASLQQTQLVRLELNRREFQPLHSCTDAQKEACCQQQQERGQWICFRIQRVTNSRTNISNNNNNMGEKTKRNKREGIIARNGTDKYGRRLI